MAEKLREADSYILFELAGTTYGVPSREVQHMEMVEHITPVPNASPHLEGVVFSRGDVVPAINLRQRFGFPKAAPTLSSRLIILKIGQRRVGLIVDAAREFREIAADAIQPPHESITGLSGSYLAGIAKLGERLVLLLNISEVINYTGAEVSIPASENGTVSAVTTNQEKVAKL
jgi:purine-binding chemotaxis protein CheW